MNFFPHGTAFWFRIAFNRHLIFLRQSEKTFEVEIGWECEGGNEDWWKVNAENIGLHFVSWICIFIDKVLPSMML
jgi:hypothetical protein